MKTRFFLTLTTLFLLCSVATAGTISLESLLDEMVDRSRLARFPAPAYTCRQASSFDRGAKSPGKHWFANNDRSKFLRSEKNAGREEWVMMDAQGPGVIVRFWVIASLYKGTIRVYIDSNETPAIEAKVDELIGGDALVGPPLSEERARGRNLYLPIPYAKHCKVTFDRPNFHVTKDRGDLLYYQINYRTYTPGAEVASFSTDALKQAQDRIARLQKTLRDPGSVFPEKAQVQPAETLEIAPGEEASMALEGPSAICRLEGRLKADDPVQALRSTVLIMEFDGEQTVWCPLGDFFGSGVGINPYTGWYRQVEKDGTLRCWWIMPFRESCTLTVKNMGDQTVRLLDGSLATCPWNWDDRSMHFHANWRQQRHIPTNPPVDWNYLKAKGKGVFVGDTLAVLNRSQRWWGEGDEKIFVDGESFPSHFGTGTEDYYGYGGCSPKHFESPFHAQPRAEGPRNFGNTTNTRVRLLDAIPFKNMFRFDMEVLHCFKTEVDYAATTYWYGRPGAMANSTPTQEEVRQPVQYETPYVISGFSLAEHNSGPITKKDSAGQEKRDKTDAPWWTRLKPGDKIRFEGEVRKTGRYALRLIITQDSNYGIVQFYLNGRKIGKPVDFYARKPHYNQNPVNLGTFALDKGKHVLTAEIIGANPKAQKRFKYMEYVFEHGFEIEQILLKPVP